jgi:L-rhamnonate dehydratase
MTAGSPIVSLTVSVVPYPGPPEPKGIDWHIGTPISSIDGADRFLRGQSTAGLPPGRVLAVIVELTDENGVTGTGPAGFGHAGSVEAISALAPIVIGRLPSETGWTWEMMYRSTLNVGRRGLLLHSISGIDIAMWDLFGRQTSLPVHRLLGGPVRSAQSAYASVLHPTADLDRLAADANMWSGRGFSALKLWLSGGPADGAEGIRRNLAMLGAVRDGVQPGTDIIADAYMSWDINYAVRSIRAIEDAGFRLRWMEEPVSADDPSALAKVRKAVDTPIGSGEHEATRYGFRQLLELGAVDVLQPDPTRLGGITESRRVWALGESFGVEVIGHLGYASNLHMALASHSTPLVEYFPPHVAGHPDEDEVFRWIYPDEPEPDAGRIQVPTAPGLGVELDRQRVTAVARVTAAGSELLGPIATF